jgi:uncharacterized protein YceK
MKRALRALGFAGILALAGCGTISNLGDRPKIFGGVREDARSLTQGGPCWSPMGCLDMPFSLALDIVVLPFTAIYELAHPADPDPASP